MTNEHRQRIRYVMEQFETLNFALVTQYVASHAQEVQESETFDELSKWLAFGAVAATLENFHYREVREVE